MEPWTLEKCWNVRRRVIHDHIKGLIPVIELAYKSRKLRRLAPVTSLHRLFFSHCTTCHFHTLLPLIISSEEKFRLVTGPEKDPIKSGLMTAEDIIKTLEDMLPDEVPEAFEGDRDEMKAAGYKVPKVKEFNPESKKT